MVLYGGRAAMRRQRVDTHFNRDCVPNFSAVCPHLWSNDGNYCRAPSDYEALSQSFLTSPGWTRLLNCTSAACVCKGDCGFFVQAAHLTNDQKEAWAEACNARELNFVSSLTVRLSQFALAAMAARTTRHLGLAKVAETAERTGLFYLFICVSF